MDSDTLGTIAVFVVVVILWNIARNVGLVADHLDAIRRMLSQRFPDPDDDDSDESDDSA